MKKENLTEFEEYLHNKIVSIYGSSENLYTSGTLKGSLKMPNNIHNLIQNHQPSNLNENLDNYPRSFHESKLFYDNLMQSLQQNKRKLDNCYRISTNSIAPNLMRFSKNNTEIKTTEKDYLLKSFEFVDKDEIFNQTMEDYHKTQQNFIKKPQSASSTKKSQKIEIFYDSLQKKHINRIRSAKVFGKSKKKMIKMMNFTNNEKNQQYNDRNESAKTIKPTEMQKINTFKLSEILKEKKPQEKFPAWVLERNDFQAKLQSPEFNLNSKILKICEKPLIF